MIVVRVNNSSPILKELVPSPELEYKKWSYSNVYHLKDLRNIYMLVYSKPESQTIHNIYRELILNNISSESGKDWTERKILENINALRNFGLIESDKVIVRCGALFSSCYQEDLSENDKEIFSSIFFSYFRFKMFLDMLQPNEFCAHPILYAYMENSRFYNRFFVPSQNTIYYLKDEHADAMRFWEVTMKWGRVLDKINKCSMSVLDSFSSFDWLSKSVAVGLSVPMPCDFSVLNHIQNITTDGVVYIPNALWNIVEQYGYSLHHLKAQLIKECSLSDAKYCLQKASAIFVSPKEAEMLPVVGNIYMSHLLKIQ